MKTTLHIHDDILKKISATAQKQGISRSEIIIALLHKSMKGVSKPGRLGRLVQYQECGQPVEWHVLHIKLRVDDYEYFLDLRKLLKMSVSLILANAAKRYLDETLQNNIGDNYHFKDYVIIREVIDNIICWKFLWGFPPNIEKFLPL